MTDTPTTPPDDEWEVFLCTEDGFTQRDDERALALLALIEDPEQIDREYGDCIPDTITIARGSAKPQPQSPGSKHLRQPARRTTTDFMDFDVSDASRLEARMMWAAAQGAARALNAEGL